MTIRIVVTDEAPAETATAVWKLYDEAFSDQPDRSTWQTMWDTHAARPGFRLARAITGEDVLVGFVYGYTGARGQWWTDRAWEHLPLRVASTWLGGHLEVVSLAVAPSQRGKGVGRQLMGAFLDGTPHHRAALMTSADPADPAHRLYLATGWHIIGTGISPGTVIMATSLNQKNSGLQVQSAR